MTSALDSYMRKRLLSAPLWKCTRFLFVGSKVNSLQVLGFSPKRLQRYNIFLKVPNLGALFLIFLQRYYKIPQTANKLSNNLQIRTKTVFFDTKPRQIDQIICLYAGKAVLLQAKEFQHHYKDERKRHNFTGTDDT